MRERIVVTLVALAVPLVLLVDGVHVIAHGWYIRFEYGRDGFPRDPYGLTTGQRTDLAAVGLRSILPWERAGTGLLREARLPDGDPAFGGREVRHMGDVRALVWGLFVAHAAALVAIAALAALRATRPLLGRGLRLGAILTLALAGFVAVFVLVSPIGFLGGFHRVFFSGDSWRFAETDTLRRLFPDRFWSDTAIALGVATAAQAAALLGAAWLRARKAIRPPPRTARHAQPRS